MKLKTVAKTVVLDQNGRVLLLKRSQSDPRRPGEWDFPGGEVDQKEELLVGAVREIYEEAGLQIQPSSLALVYAATEAYQNTGLSVTRLLFVTQKTDGDVKLSYEHDSFQWVDHETAIELFPDPFYGGGLKYALDHDLLAKK
jgi:8-oxo-dGTP pyrophosphatase MutT (NUDIX family)